MNPGELHETLVDQLNGLLAYAAELDALMAFEDRNALAVAHREG